MINNILSYIGSILLLIALALSRKSLKTFNLLSILGSLFMSIWSWRIGSISVLILNLVYGFLAVYNLWKLRKEKK